MERKIATKDFYGPGEHLYEDELGWGPDEKEEAHSSVTKDIFEYEVITVGHCLGFYYADNQTYYALHSEDDPIEFKILPKDLSEPYIGWQCEVDTHHEGEVLYTFDELSMKIWDTIRIDGKDLGEVIDRSLILYLC